MNNFWINQHTIDFFTLLVIFLWVLTAIILHKIPHVLYMISEGLKYNRIDDFSAYLKRFTRPWFLNLMIHVIDSLCLGIGCYKFYMWQNLVSLSDFAGSIRLFAILVVLFFLFFTLRRMVYRLLAGLFLEQAKRQQFFQAYHFFETIYAMLMVLPVTFIWINGAVIVGLITMGVLFVVWRISIWVLALAVLRKSDIGIMHLFLYLCAHELLPFIYMIFGINYLVNSNVYMTLFP